ncbi:ATP-dependent RNA helicase [Actinidia chinensis var. chinensis]|uniref:ATP-dependent RNA helicase n=1 Tax=Actinidia chinensis var. chinensis TaxID=1590841 RepID=A0A2R6PVZ7_ACTCC|nr:ATP-dependent RNA helicase [Actinidia chinensis var. chinensis]
MKILLLVFVLVALIWGNLQASAERLASVNRKLISDASLGRKVGIGANEKVSINENKDTEENNERTSTDADSDDDETNKSYGKFFHGCGSTIDPHHHYYIDYNQSGH